MFITKCPYCQSSDVKKNGIRRGSQFYKCKCCKKQFFNSAPKPTPSIILKEYLEGKQTISEIALSYHVSESTVKRLLRKITFEWKQPSLRGRRGFVHLDASLCGCNYNYSSSRIYHKRYHYRWQTRSIFCPCRVSYTDVPIPYDSNSYALFDKESEDECIQRTDALMSVYGEQARRRLY